MIRSLIEQAKKVLFSIEPGDDELNQAESSLSTYLEALATNRISDQVEMDDLEEANRLLREIRREKSRRQAGGPPVPVAPAEAPMTPQVPVPPSVSPSEAIPASLVEPIAEVFQAEIQAPVLGGIPEVPPPITRTRLGAEDMGGIDHDPLKRFSNPLTIRSRTAGSG